MAWEVVTVTKREAASRQLDQAIHLFFRRGDMLAVHTLAAAAFRLLTDLGKPQGIVSLARSEALIKPEAMKKWNDALNSTQNFLKHADRDTEATLRYVEEGTVFLLFEAVELAERLRMNNSRARLALRLWFAFSFPDVIKPEIVAALRATNPIGLDQTDRDLWARWITSP